MEVKEGTPEYRVYAFANLDLEEHMAEMPLEITNPGRVKWDVEGDGTGNYIATGVIKVPISMFFRPDEENEGDLICDRIQIKDNIIYDDSPIDDSWAYDPFHGINEIRMMADARIVSKKK